MLIDSHCHIPDEKYNKPLSQILTDAKDAGVVKFITIGTSLEDDLLKIKTANENDEIFAAIGVYPHEEQNKSLGYLKDQLAAQLKSSKKIVAVGECGLDLVESTDTAYTVRNKTDQISLFKMQIELAIDHNLPIIIHNRNGDEVIFDILDEYKGKNLRGAAHCFSTTLDTAHKYLDRGFYLSFSGMITYKGRDELLKVVADVPDNRFLVETDSPYLPLQGFRGQVNEPKFVEGVAKKIAEVRQMPFEKVCDLSYSNTCDLFNI